MGWAKNKNKYWLESNWYWDPAIVLVPMQLPYNVQIIRLITKQSLLLVFHDFIHFRDE
jgi:hypothetical protein